MKKSCVPSERLWSQVGKGEPSGREWEGWWWKVDVSWHKQHETGGRFFLFFECVCQVLSFLASRRVVDCSFEGVY